MNNDEANENRAKKKYQLRGSGNISQLYDIIVNESSMESKSMPFIPVHTERKRVSSTPNTTTEKTNAKRKYYNRARRQRQNNNRIGRSCQYGVESPTAAAAIQYQCIRKGK